MLPLEPRSYVLAFASRALNLLTQVGHRRRPLCPQLTKDICIDTMALEFVSCLKIPNASPAHEVLITLFFLSKLGLHFLPLATKVFQLIKVSSKLGPA